MTTRAGRSLSGRAGRDECLSDDRHDDRAVGGTAGGPPRGGFVLDLTQTFDTLDHAARLARTQTTALGRLETFSNQRRSALCASGAGKLIALVAKSTVTKPV